MGFNCGIVGLPNVGKSTIFNALTSGKAEAANFPFCTIEPNTGIVAVPDKRLTKLSKIANSAQVIPTTIEFVDIAGLVQGASKGEGLGNQFLGHIRSVDAVVHVVRCFLDENVTHVNTTVDPVRDVEIVETELMLADLASVDKRIDRVKKLAKGGDSAARDELATLECALARLSDGKVLLGAEGFISEDTSLDLITAKPVLYVANVGEADVVIDPHKVDSGPIAQLVTFVRERKAEIVVISGAVESEISELPIDERSVFLEDIGLSMSGLDRLIDRGYGLLDLITFFTAGPKETRAWTCVRGAKAPQAAGKIHTDFEKGFIRAEVTSFDDYVSCGGETGAKAKGRTRIEGKDYVVEDGDVVHFRFNV